MWIRLTLLALSGLTAGFAVAGGVFTVFTAVGLVPRFADRTASADRILLYENGIVAGTFFGTFFDLYKECGFRPMQMVKQWMQASGAVFQNGFLVAYGIFTGIYVGCLAVSIAEILDSIPIMARRVRLKRGIGIVLAAFAFGKLAGSVLYFAWGI